MTLLCIHNGISKHVKNIFIVPSSGVEMDFHLFCILTSHLNLITFILCVDLSCELVTCNCKSLQTRLLDTIINIASPLSAVVFYTKYLLCKPLNSVTFRVLVIFHELKMQCVDMRQ